MPADELSTPAGRLALLATGEITIEGRMPWSSNATFLVEVAGDGMRARAIYKPVRGERPLWDFEPGLHRRELAAYALSEALGLGLVPPTLIRDGPLGEGSVQWFVEADHSQHYFTIYEAHPELHDALRDVAFFDLLANNTDRKSGHVLLDHELHVWGIDHGLCFAAEPKLRTVVWEFGGEPLPDRLVALASDVAVAAPARLDELLSPEEVHAVRERASRLVERPVFPDDTSGRRYPWPLV